MPPSVAIIMRAKNEMPHAAAALEKLSQQSFSGFDLYAIDSGSTDGTLEELRKYTRNLERIQPEAYIPGRVLNGAIGRTHHEIIVLLNADAIPQSPDWLKHLIQPILTQSADATFSRQVARRDARFIVDYDYARAYDPAQYQSGFFSAVACAFTRTLWQSHPFPENGYAEDTAWAKAVCGDGARIQLRPDSVVEHSHNYSLEALFQKRFRQACTLGEKPSALRQSLCCLREMVRDLLHAGVKMKLHTVPYNMLYRIAIHRAIHHGRRAGWEKRAPGL